ncbi:Multidrug efflux pump subunit AcrA (membrane-fusion protein) [Palleronia salina]|uniref:Multidrug efflux pump subunit AcrA (Membrane-fusion protein) n=1 Tax=Palleronia salina TaxID=313368 RepID=A0A1M6LLN1_9RHOB|nr:HlyD family efflux transporter periplasmic adaptor subunit [Palleronia salina]SHJ72126.1 Multidrug efflux pump subunit AcrA (membrane-fusion protein) [Palleronia salina]
MVGSESETAGVTEEAEGPVSYAMLDRTLWTRFRDAGTVPDFLLNWLGLLARQVDGLATAILVTLDESGAPVVAAQWPTGGAPEPELLAAARSALESGHSIAQGEDGARRVLAHPISVSGESFGAVALAAPASAPTTPVIFRRLQWGEAWVELMLRREREARDGELRERTTIAFDVLASLLERPALDDAAIALVTDLARRLDCETVSLGLRKGRRIKVRAVSSAASFGRRASLIREVGLAMDEAVDQEAVVLWPEPQGWDFRVSLAHADLARTHGVGSVLTIPMTAGDEITGALTFERREGHPFDTADIDICDAVAAIAGPVIEDRRRAARWFPRRMLDGVAAGGKALVGPSHFAAKLATVAVIAVAAALWFVPRAFEVSAPARVEGIVQRSVVAPFNSYLASEAARAGDRVSQGDVIARLDDRDLTLERMRLGTTRAQQSRELDRAIAERAMAEASVVRAQLDQTDAQIALVDEQLARTRIVAPFDGYIVEGDLSQSIGASIERGQTLFRIAPLDAFRVVLEVGETDIDAIRPGQEGALRLQAFPETPFPFVVEKLTPLARQGEGRNWFRVEAALVQDADTLRPGMEGISRTLIGERRLGEVLFHDLIDWARLAWWRWQP